MSGRFFFNFTRTRITQTVRATTTPFFTTTRSMSSSTTRTMIGDSTTTATNTTRGKTTGGRTNNTTNNNNTTSSTKNFSQMTRTEQKAAFEAMFASQAARQSVAHFTRLGALTSLAQLGSQLQYSFFNNETAEDR